MKLYIRNRVAILFLLILIDDIFRFIYIFPPHRHCHHTFLGAVILRFYYNYFAYILAITILVRCANRFKPIDTDKIGLSWYNSDREEAGYETTGNKIYICI